MTAPPRRLLKTGGKAGVWPDSVQVPGETLSFSGCPPVVGVALIWLAFSPGTVRGEAQKGFVLLEVAVPSLLSAFAFRPGEVAHGRDHRDGPAQAVGDDRGDRRPGRGAGRGPVWH